MLSSQQRLLLRAARRNIPSRNAPMFSHTRKPNQGSAALSTIPFAPDTRRSDDKASNASGLPIIHLRPLQGGNGLLSTTVLQRAHPLWRRFSTAAKVGPQGKNSMKERADHYREKASEYGSKAKEGAQSFGGMMKKYGPTFIGTYLSVYATNLSLFYLGIESGMMDPMTVLGYITGNHHEEVRTTAEIVSELLQHYTITAPFAETVQEKPQLANFAVAWVSTKFTEPIRFALSVAIVPRVARFLGVVPKKETEESEAVVSSPSTDGDGANVKTEEPSEKEEKKP